MGRRAGPHGVREASLHPAGVNTSVASDKARSVTGSGFVRDAGLLTR
jgi:hypothetical protein